MEFLLARSDRVHRSLGLLLGHRGCAADLRFLQRLVDLDLPDRGGLLTVVVAFANRLLPLPITPLGGEPALQAGSHRCLSRTLLWLAAGLLRD